MFFNKFFSAELCANQYIGSKYKTILNSYHNILQKLNRFAKKYYLQILIKGGLLFLSLGLLFFLAVLAIEYFLWLNSNGRLVLFLVFVGVALFLLYAYIAVPIFYLFKIKKGISNREASVLIGKHFPEIGDRLLNLLDLAEDQDRSELLLASMEQRSKEMGTVPFIKAIDFKESFKYAKYLLVPVLIFGLIALSGNFSSFFGSYKRVVNYDLAYEPPAPFSFEVLAGNGAVLESKSYPIQVTTKGSIQPEDIYMVIDSKEFLLQKRNGTFQYVFEPPLEDTRFYFKANGVTSKTFELNALKAPAIQEFNIILDYPDYTKKPTERLKGTGNATFPEGTNVSWEIVGQHTESIQLITEDTTLIFSEKEEQFQLSKRIYDKFKYQLSTSNENVRDYEKLDYEFTVIKDAYPTIKANQILDSLNPNVAYYSGEASDDYQLQSISLICYPVDESDKKQIVQLNTPNRNFEQFYYTFPSGLELEEGRNYSFYFEAKDNDAIHKGKTTKTAVFNLQILDDNQLKNKQLENQQSLIKNIDDSLDKFKEQKETLKEINKNQKEKNNLNFNDQNQIKDFLKKQQQQESLMEKFSKQLKENLEKDKADDPLNKLLKERLERQEIEAKKNERLLEELDKIADKINKEELTKRLEEVAKKQQTSERNLEQLLELTKRYYVTEKASQLTKDLEKLAKEQEELSESNKENDSIKGEQEKLNKTFEELAKELNELKKDNAKLKKPLELKVDKPKEESVKKDQKEALEELNKGEESQNPEKREESKSEAGKKQKSAAQKMKQMSQQLQQSSAGGGGGSSVTEDAEMLRQILDNLITFSFKQEKLFNGLQENDVDVTQFSNNVKRQQELRGLFEHVDDSLFALSLRRAELSEFVNEQITEVYYNVDKALENMAENRIYQGVSYQKYVLNASNSLADFLANILDNMQQSMQSGQGSGGGEGFQLPDIIKSQGKIGEQMGQMGKSGKKGQGQKGSGKEQNEGENGKDGENDNGASGKNGNRKGENGNEEGQGDGEGEKEGESGQGKGRAGENGEGSGQGGQGELSEDELKEIYEIYKEQQRIRQELEKQLEDFIKKTDKDLAKKLVRQMEDFENDLLENGITEQNLNKANNIQYRLLKLEKAALKQGKKEERESNTNTNSFRNPITTKPSVLDNYKNQIEILNRQALPLQQIFQNKVKRYFKNEN